jgi:2-hydroxychromene-2-carboxylate isomerase
VTDPTAIDTARLTVLLDLRHPLAYLALHPAEALADSLGLEINWLPVVVPNLRPPTPPLGDDDRGLRHRRYRAEAIAREIEIYAQAQGLVLEDVYRDGDSGAACEGWLWLRAHRPDLLPRFLAELFRAYWSLELEASNREQVAALIDSLGADGAGFGAARAECAAASAEVANELGRRGLYQVPAFLVEDEVFYGRQHLPMLRWILEGRSGAIPI